MKAWPVTITSGGRVKQSRVRSWGDRLRRRIASTTPITSATSGIGPNNIIATQGGRDALVKAYQAMLTLGHGRQGDLVIVSRVPWISYNWGPYGIGANVLLAPGRPEEGWTYSADALRACVEFGPGWAQNRGPGHHQPG